jgi:glycosyltransferase involved in cell wall biosynthesis
MIVKILHLQTELNLACGVTRTISQIIKNSSHDFENHLIALGGDGLSRFESFKLKPIIKKYNNRSLFNTLKISYYIFNYCRTHSIKIIHSHHRYFDTIAWLLKPFINVKTITSVQSKVYGRKLLSYKADRLVACSNSIKEHLIKAFTINEKKLIVIHNSFDPSEIKLTYTKEQLKKILNLENDETILGFVGRLNNKEKGIDILIKALLEVIKKVKNLHLLLIGNGPDREELIKLIKIENLPATFVKAQENIFDYLNLIDVFILPSRVEPFGIVLIEAGILNKPVVASNVDGIPEIIENEKNGLLFKSDNFEELTKCILRIINDSKLAQDLSENLHKKVSENFLSSTMVEKYETEYKKLIGINDI